MRRKYMILLCLFLAGGCGRFDPSPAAVVVPTVTSYEDWKKIDEEEIRYDPRVLSDLRMVVSATQWDRMNKGLPPERRGPLRKRPGGP